MNINLKSPVSILKGLGMILAYGAAGVAAIKALAWLVNLALPGKGEFVKAPYRI
jgi:hypothetical protein